MFNIPLVPGSFCHLCSSGIDSDEKLQHSEWLICLLGGRGLAVDVGLLCIQTEMQAVSDISHPLDVLGVCFLVAPPWPWAGVCPPAQLPRPPLCSGPQLCQPGPWSVALLLSLWGGGGEDGGVCWGLWCLQVEGAVEFPSLPACWAHAQVGRRPGACGIRAQAQVGVQPRSPQEPGTCPGREQLREPAGAWHMPR